MKYPERSLRSDLFRRRRDLRIAAIDYATIHGDADLDEDADVSALDAAERVLYQRAVDYAAALALVTKEREAEHGDRSQG